MKRKMALPKIINNRDEAFELLGTQPIPHGEQDVGVWIEKKKDSYGADTVLLNGNLYYFCSKIIDAEFEEIKDE